MNKWINGYHIYVMKHVPGLTGQSSKTHFKAFLVISTNASMKPIVLKIIQIDGDSSDKVPLYNFSFNSPK